MGGDPRALQQVQAALNTVYQDDVLGQDTLSIMDTLEKLDPDNYHSAFTNYPDTEFGLALQQTAMLIKAEVGLEVSAIPKGADYVFVTPNHHCPTMVAMSEERRQALLADAEANDRVIIEDGYDSQLADEAPQQALKSADRAGRVIYVGSMSKTLAPGLRLGFIVAPAPLVAELRALRRFMLRHPPANNQRAVALFDNR